MPGADARFPIAEDWGEWVTPLEVLGAWRGVEGVGVKSTMMAERVVRESITGE